MKLNVHHWAEPISPGQGADMRQAMEALTRSREALREWKARGLRQRVKLVGNFRALLAESCETAASTASGSTGRGLAEVLASEVLPLLDAGKFLSRNAIKVLGNTRYGWHGRPAWLAGHKAEVSRAPWGVVLVIAPSNYPLLLPGVQCLQALIAGNVVLLKPGVSGSASAILVRDLLHRAGVPSDCLQVLPENPAIVKAVMALGVDKVVFTGSAQVGARLLNQLANTLTPATMELSGSDPIIVRHDADLDMAARAVAFGLTLNSGRTCIAPRRIIVSRQVATQFEGRLASALSRVQGQCRGVGNLPDGIELLRRELRSGAHLLAGHIDETHRIAAPIVLGGISPDSDVLREDWFGPIAFVLTADSDEAAIAAADRSAYALGASIFTKDPHAARQMAERLRSGVVSINDLIVPTSDPRLPFGGAGFSGFGVTRGREGLLEMTRPKVLTIQRMPFRPHYNGLEPQHASFLREFVKISHSGTWLARARAVARFVTEISKRFR